MGCMNLRSAVPTIAPMEDLNVSIYALCDPRTDEIRYVGKAIDPQKRLGGHINAAKLGRARHKDNWVRSLLRDGVKPEMRILEEVPMSSWQEAERSWIRQLSSMGCRLTNATEGGDQGEFTAEAVQRRNAAIKEAYKSPELREKMRALALKNGNKPPVRKGERNNKAKLTDEKVLVLRRRFAEGEILRELAAEIGISHQAAWYIVTGATWKHVGGPIHISKVKKRLSDSDIIEIRKRWADGETQMSIAKAFGVVPSYVSQIVSGVRRRRSE